MYIVHLRLALIVLTYFYLIHPVFHSRLISNARQFYLSCSHRMSSLLGSAQGNYTLVAIQEQSLRLGTWET
jgi:hypothetical protein